MPEGIYLNDPEWANLLLDQPRLGEMLMACMQIQPDIDPQAGFGVMQPYAMWRQLDLPDELIPVFLARADNPYKVYVALRGFGLLYLHRDNVIANLEAGEPFHYKGLLEYVSSICNSFRVDLAAPHCNGEPPCRLEIRLPRKPKKAAS